MCKGMLEDHEGYEKGPLNVPGVLSVVVSGRSGGCRRGIEKGGTTSTSWQTLSVCNDLVMHVHHVCGD